MKNDEKSLKPIDNKKILESDKTNKPDKTNKSDKTDESDKPSGSNKTRVAEKFIFGKSESNKAKGIAIILLVFHHLCFMNSFFKTYSMKSILPQRIVVDMAVLARICVPIFIFISAFGTAKIYIAKKNEMSVFRFICSRLIILMSARWFIYPFQLLLAYTLRGNTIGSIYKHSFKYAFFDFMGWGDFFKTPMIAGINWYIFLAQLIIIFTPVVCKMIENYGKASLFFAYILMVLLKGNMVSSFGGDYVNYIFISILGCLFASECLFDKLKYKHKYILAFSLFVILLGLLYFKRAASYSKFDYKGTHMVGFAFAALIICMLVSIFHKNILLKPLEVLGEYSGNIFYLHIFVIKCDLLHDKIDSVALLLIVSVVICFILSVIIELIKKLIHFNQFVLFIKKKIS